MTSPPPADALYRERLGSRRAEELRHRRRSEILSTSRLLVFAAGILTAWLVFESNVLGAGWLALPAAAFGALVFVHDRVLAARERAQRGVVFYERGLARLENRWMGKGDGGLRYLDPRHPYASDLDLFGSGSLFELLATTRTAAGSHRLAERLLQGAPADEIRRRQEAVGELVPRVDLREELGLLGESPGGGPDPDALERWAAGPPLLDSRVSRLAALLFSAVTLVTLALWLADVVGRTPLIVALGLEISFAMWLRPRVKEALASIEGRGADLELLSRFLARLEREDFSSARLVELQQQWFLGRRTASERLAHLRSRIELTEARRNKLFAPLAALLLWGTQFAFALEVWRKRHGDLVPRWMASVAEMDFLIALATYAYERPEDRFPEILEEGPRFEARGLGHPLIPAARLVRNDLRLGPDLQLLLVSGSNMSGKSTLLRAVGTNAVLALAGAPVRAQALRISVLAMGASIRIQDSLQEGVSRFYAEIQRLRQIMDMAGRGQPLLFLLDEILHGTNSHDRRIGAEAVVRQLVRRGALGLVTTHDLALARIADSLSPRAANVHFVDHLEEGKIRFDYLLRPGVVTKSNALDLMRSVGLEV